MRGRKPVPTQILKVRGSAKARRPLEPAAEPLEIAPDPPAHLDKIAADRWRTLAPLCQSMGTLAKADLDWLAVYCSAFSRMIRAEAKLRDGGEVVTHHNGVEGQSHWLKVHDLAIGQMIRASERLGLSAMDRTRLHVQVEMPPAVQSRSRFFNSPFAPRQAGS